ncbi:MAG: IclR family transcriptional regulator [Eubacteriales bacterium]|nr:IclR family transcriptional regulator [Eubacteriales bacterium]
MESTVQKAETIKMVESAMSVLDLLRGAKTPLGVNAVAKTCALNPSTAFRILKTLEKTGWVYQLEEGQYIAGEKLSFVTDRNNFHIALSDAAKCPMEQCTARHGLAMNLIVRNGPDCYILQQSLTKSIINYVPPLHSVLPYYACGGGKILLCELPETLVDQLLETHRPEALTPFTITDPEEYKRLLVQTEKDGYAIDFQESSINGSCIAVPVRDKDGTIIASLSFSGLIGVSAPEKLLKYVPYLTECSKVITDTLYKCWEI